jgi:hypothetical protein
MGRFVLAIYLSLHTIVGPWLCCCSLATFASISCASAAPEADRPAEKRSCCHGKGEPTRPPEKGDSDTPSKPHSCPCQQGHPEIASALPSDTLAEQVSLRQGFHGWFLAALCLTAAPAVHASLIALSNGNPLPFWTADDLLRTHHVLRC